MKILHVIPFIKWGSIDCHILSQIWNFSITHLNIINGMMKNKYEQKFIVKCFYSVKYSLANDIIQNTFFKIISVVICFFIDDYSYTFVEYVKGRIDYWYYWIEIFKKNLIFDSRQFITFNWAILSIYLRCMWFWWKWFFVLCYEL